MEPIEVAAAHGLAASFRLAHGSVACDLPSLSTCVPVHCNGQPPSS